MQWRNTLRLGQQACFVRSNFSLPDPHDLPSNPLQHPYPLRGWDSDLAQYSNTPSLRAAGLEDEDDDEDENEAPGGQVAFCISVQGLKPLAESCHPFGISSTRPTVQSTA
jgi:hypothetical protein